MQKMNRANIVGYVVIGAVVLLVAVALGPRLVADLLSN